MRHKKKPGARVSHERWLVSYADFITLLFAFFVVLYATAQVDKHKVGMLAQAIQSAFQELGVFRENSSQIPAVQPGAPSPEEMSPQERDELKKMMVSGLNLSPPTVEVKRLLNNLEQILAPEIKKQEIRVREGPDGVVLSLQEVGFYDPGSDQLRQGAEAILSRLAPTLLSYGGNLRIEGHTDDVPIHNARFASNWELSTARATGLVRVFIDEYRFDPQHLSAAGYAEFHPVSSNSSPEGRRMNRRIDIVILPHKPASSPQAPATADPKTIAHKLDTPS